MVEVDDPRTLFSDDATVARIARLARLDLSVEERATLGDQLGKILEYVAALAEVDTEGVPVATSGVAIGADRPRGLRINLSAQERAANAPAMEDGAFRVPKVIG